MITRLEDVVDVGSCRSRESQSIVLNEPIRLRKSTVCVRQAQRRPDRTSARPSIRHFPE